MFQAQQQYAQPTAPAVTYPSEGERPPPAYGAAPPAYGQAYPPQQSSGLYPSLDSYMGLEFTPQVVSEMMRVVPQNQVFKRSA